MIQKKLLTLLLVFIACFAYAQDTPIDTSARPSYAIGKINAFKLSPIWANLSFRGVVVSYETGLTHPRWTLNTAVRYFSGIDSTEVANPTRSNVRVEFQPRFWIRRAFHQGFVAPLVGINDNGEPIIGAVTGLQFSYNGFLFDFFIGLQNKTPTEQTNSSVLLKYGMNFGYKFKVGK